MSLKKARDHALTVALGLLIYLGYLVVRSEFDQKPIDEPLQAEAIMARKIQAFWPRMTSTRNVIASNAEAPILIEFGAYDCAYCRLIHTLLMELVDAGEAQLIYVHVPLSGGEVFRDADRASSCSAEQGVFRDFHHLLMTDGDWRVAPEWATIAARAGVPDIPELIRCIESEEVDLRLTAEKTLADDMQIFGTPAFITSTRFFYGDASRVQLLDALKAPAR